MLTVIDVSITSGDVSLCTGQSTVVTADAVPDPGAYVWYNRDDDNKNDTEDREDSAVTGENDLLKVKCAFNSFFGSLQKGKVVIERGNTKLRLWKQKPKGAGQEVSFTANKKTYDLSEEAGRTAFADDILGKDLWLEGYAASAALKDTELKLTFEDGDATCHRAG